MTINADETLGAGSYIEGDIVGPGVYGGRMVQQNQMGEKNLGEPENKGQNMALRLPREAAEHAVHGEPADRARSPS